jgi:hypothetical protein
MVNTPGACVTVKARLLLQVKFTCVVTVPRIGPGDVDGSMFIGKAILPVEPPTKAHPAWAVFTVQMMANKNQREMRCLIVRCFDRISFTHYSKKRSLLQAPSTGI